MLPATVRLSAFLTLMPTFLLLLQAALTTELRGQLEKNNYEDERPQIIPAYSVPIYTYTDLFDPPSSNVTNFIEILNRYAEKVEADGSTKLLTLHQLLMTHIQIQPLETWFLMFEIGGLRVDQKLDSNIKIHQNLLKEIAFFIEDGRINKVIKKDKFLSFKQKTNVNSLTKEEISGLFDSCNIAKKDEIGFWEFHQMSSVLTCLLTMFKEVAKLKNALYVTPDQLKEPKPSEMESLENISDEPFNRVPLPNTRRTLGSKTTYAITPHDDREYPLNNQLKTVNSEREMANQGNFVPDVAAADDDRKTREYTFNNLLHGQIEILMKVNPSESIDFIKFKSLRRNYELTLLFNRIDANGDQTITAVELHQATRGYLDTYEFQMLFKAVVMSWYVGGARTQGKASKVKGLKLTSSADFAHFTDTLLRLKIMEVFQMKMNNEFSLNSTSYGTALNSLLGDTINYSDWYICIDDPIDNMSFENFYELVAPLYKRVFNELMGFLDMRALFLQTPFRGIV